MHYLETTVLVAAFVDDHPDHAACLALVARADPSRCATSGHALAEVFAVTTAMPRRPRITAMDVAAYFRALEQRLSLVSLSPKEYLAMIGSRSREGLVGGAIYDCLHVAAAAKAKATVIVTLDADFGRLFAGRVVSPANPGF